MLHKIDKMFGGAIAMMCLVSTLAIAQPPPPGVPPPPTSMPLVCTKIDANGYCIEARAQDDKMVPVRVEGVKVSEKITCVTSSDGSMTCTKVTTTVK
jgi:hypothetical protein